MEFLPKNPILEFEENTMEDMRKKYGFDKVDRINEAIDILDTWVRKQNHFMMKDFSRRYFESTILQCKGSIEKAKTKIDKMCTFRTLLPQFFGNFDMKNDFKDFMEFMDLALLPKQAPEHNRVIYVKVSGNQYTPSFVLNLSRIGIMMGEYLKVNDYSDGYVFVFDVRDANIMDIVKNADVVDIRNSMSIFMDGIGARIKGIHVVTESKAIEILVAILKQALSKKIGERISVHKNYEEVYNVLPKDIFPVDLGGKAKPLSELREDFITALCSEEATEYRRHINTACTDEKLRQSDVFKDEYMGMPGSFRVLSVD